MNRIKGVEKFKIMIFKFLRVNELKKIGFRRPTLGLIFPKKIHLNGFLGALLYSLLA